MTQNQSALPLQTVNGISDIFSSVLNGDSLLGLLVLQLVFNRTGQL